MDEHPPQKSFSLVAAPFHFLRKQVRRSLLLTILPWDASALRLHEQGMAFLNHQFRENSDNKVI